MPSRVIRGEINSSASLSRVSIGAELTFDRLITAVDDYGRFDARPEMLKAGLFPVREDTPPVRVMQWVHELAKEGCVQLYEVGGRPYLAMTAWEKHRGKGRRGTESKFPKPPETPSPASEDSSDPPENHSDPPGGRGSGDEKRGTGVVNAASPQPAHTKSSQKRKTQCPEELDAEQWARVFAWRDREHPKKFWDAELQAQWKLCRDHHIGKGNLWVDWVRAFYSWLTGPFYKQATTSDAVTRAVPIYKCPDDFGPRLPTDLQKVADILEDFHVMREEDMPRRGRH